MGSWKSATITSSETVLIRPESPTTAAKRHLALSNLDRIASRIYTPVILLYTTPANSGFQVVAASLKDALRKALVEYYPFAGRLVKGDDGLAEVRCDDAGAFFTEVTVAEALAEVGGVEGCVMLSGMQAANLSTTGTARDYQELPPLVIQVTSFKCKSVVLAVNWHHHVCDGASGMSFMKAWSELARGLPITSLPDHRRHLLLPRVPPQPLGDYPKTYSVQDSEVEEDKPCKKVGFTISGEEIQHLKQQAAGTFTSGECISAHLWRLVTKARGLNRDDTTTFFTVVDGRKRMKGFPVNYFGNCIFHRRVDCAVAEVLDMPLGHLAQLVHDSIAGITEDDVRAVVDYIEVRGASDGSWSLPRLATHNLESSSWRYFPIYDLDFGFGRPIYGGRNSPCDGSTGFAVFSPTASPCRDGSVVITVFLYPEAADALSADLVHKSMDMSAHEG